MINDFSVDVSVFRLDHVARRRSIFFIVPAAPKTPVERRAPKLICRWAVDPDSGRLYATWEEVAQDGRVSQIDDQDKDPERREQRILGLQRRGRAHARAA